MPVSNVSGNDPVPKNRTEVIPYLKKHGIRVVRVAKDRYYLKFNNISSKRRKAIERAFSIKPGSNELITSEGWTGHLIKHFEN